MSDTDSVRACTQREAARLMAAQRNQPQQSHGEDDGCLRLPHVTVVAPAQLTASAGLEEIRQRARHDQPHTAGDDTVTSHWLLSVPTSLRHNMPSVVQYLCMVVAIDFRHWGEKPCSLTTSPSSPALAAPGEPVTTFTGFYTVVEAPTSPGVAAAAPSDILYAEQTTPTNASAASAPPDVTATKKTFLRGSAAMMHLLREAVDVHGLPWYDPTFLSRFQTVEEAIEALKPCFFGCELDGVTPMWMPATRERVTLLLSLRDALLARQVTFYDLLQDCDGRVFGQPHAFVPRLRTLHPRYQDVSQAPLLFGDDRPFPILKLSQLTALALNDALPALWHDLQLHHGAVVGEDRSVPWLRQAREASLRTAPTLFTDADCLSICCDYQIPKALRAAGLLVYDAHLAALVDNHVLLAPGGLEEVAIRVATLVSTEWLLEWLNTPSGADPERAVAAVPVTSLDHALWYVGRYMTDATAKHHLCRTIMY